MTADGVPVPRDRVTVGPDGAMVVTFAKPVSAVRVTWADLEDMRAAMELAELASGTQYPALYAICPDSCEEDE